MNVCGIVTEYNPMHMGHAYQLNEARKMTSADGIVLIMSGNFVQRGEPALIDKYRRAQAAVQSGVDLVVELPVYFATASAEYFSTYAMKILDSMGIVTHLNFGSESGDLTALEDIAGLLVEEPLGLRVLIHDLLAEGLSFPVAREKALLTYCRNHDLLDEATVRIIENPNNILGVEYIKALKQLKSTIIPTTLKRVGADYHNDDSHVPIPSATSIRRHLLREAPMEELRLKMPPASYDAVQKSITDMTGPIFIHDIYPFLKHQLLVGDPASLKEIADMGEGLENRILNQLDFSQDYEGLMNALMTKRYTRTRISRALLHILLNHQKNAFDRFYRDMAPYIKVLALSRTGQKMIRAIREFNEELPIIVNNRQGYKQLDDLQKACYMADLNSSRVYANLVAAKYGTKLKNDYQQQIIPL